MHASFTGKCAGIMGSPPRECCQFAREMIPRPTNAYEHYHAHVYFDEHSAPKAQALCTRAGELFGVLVGRFHRRLVGPHPHWSCQLTFDSSQFDALIPWLEAH